MAYRFELSFLLLRWPFASVAAAAPLLGCGPGDVDQSFRVTRIEFDGGSAITLTFSQPIANADAIDPNDFRISFVRTSSQNYSDPYTGEMFTNRFTAYRDVGVRLGRVAQLELGVLGPGLAEAFEDTGQLGHAPA